MTEQVLVGSFEHRGCSLHDGVDRAGRDAGAEQLAEQLCGIASGDAVAHREGNDRRLQTRAEGAPGHVGRKLGAGGGAAVGTAQAMESVLREDDRNRGQLRDLVTSRLADGAAFRLAESVAAGAALGPMVDHLTDCLDRCQPATVSRMARLGSMATLRGGHPPTPRSPGRILAGRHRGVARVAGKPPLELGDSCRQLGDLNLLCGNLRRQRQEHSDDGFAPLLVDCLRLGAFHAQGIRGA